MSENPTVGVGGPSTTGGSGEKPSINGLLAKLRAKINQNGNGTPDLKGAANRLNENADKQTIKEATAIVGADALQRFDKNTNGLQFGEVINALEAHQ